MRYLDELVLKELAFNHRDSGVRQKAQDLLDLLRLGKTPEAVEHMPKPRPYEAVEPS